MKALVLEAYNALVYREVPTPTPGADEVLVRVRACGICGSDVHGLDGSTGRRIPPVIMGHEAAGEIAAVGKDVQKYSPGERVTFDSTLYCGECGPCRSGRINLCDNRRVIGVSCDEYSRDGALAEYVSVPARVLYRIPDNLTFERACTVEPLSVALHAADRLAGGPGKTALVMGAGMIGLLLLQALKVKGCGKVIVADLEPQRRELARALGADITVDPATENVSGRIAELTDGRGVDSAFDAVGLEITLKSCVDSLRKGGSVCLVGNLTPAVSLPLQKVVARELNLYGSCASAGEYPRCLEYLAGGQVKVDPLLSATAPLSEGAAWFQRLYRGEKGLLKVCLIP